MYNFSKESLWGLDLGGTKIEGVILKSAEDPEVIFRERVPTEAEMGYWHIIYQIKKVVDMMSTAAGCTPAKIGIATPGTVVPQTGLMKNCNTTALNGKLLKQDLIRILNAGVEIANDANCFALAETQLGIVKKEFPTANVVFGIIMGTGVGGGLVVNQKVINGYHGLGGEWGHNYLNEYDGQLCYCGKSGCNESILSGPSLQDYY
jgi:fructokinase